jgi:signal transduction histidine kinase/ActR/RegA family two-component response regulator
MHPSRAATTAAGPERAGARNHVVQFYDDDGFLLDAAVDFLAAGLADCESAVVIATEPHRAGSLSRLKAKGIDVDDARRDGRLTLLDARDSLSAIMDGTTPNARQFTVHIAEVFDRIQRDTGHPMRIYGEMVDLLWKDGNPAGAIQLEQLWNELATSGAFTVLCTYGMGNFVRHEHSQPFREVCRQHGQVIPTEQYQGDEDTRLREISLLQHRARVLETELGRRRELERALNHSVAARRRAEEALRASLAREQTAHTRVALVQAEADRAHQVTDEFLAVLSHELRTPLSAIVGWSHLIKTPGVDSATICRALDVIDRNVGRELHLIEDLLDVSRPAAGTLQVRADSVDLATIVSAALDSIGPAAEAKAIGLDMDVDPCGLLVAGDASRLQHVVWNLLSNAVKFTPKGGRVDLSLRQVDADAEIVVRDTGGGIAPEFLPHVFDRFRQASAGTARAHEGLGLGLAVVRHLVEAYGGRVRAESPGVGRGSTFTVRLPLRAAPADVAIDPVPGTGAMTSRTRVLIVDDNADARDLSQYILQRTGATVDTAASAVQALQLVEVQPFDVLVADIGMPNQDGYALIAAIRSHPQPRIRELPAVAVTAYAGDVYRAKVLAAGYDDHLAKPVNAADLAHAILRLRGAHP